MEILKLLSKIILILYTLNFICGTSYSNEPIDIWKIEKINKLENDNSEDIKIENEKLLQTLKIDQGNNNVIVNQDLDTSEIKLVGLYDPSDNGLTIDMWSNSDGKEIKEIFDNIKIKNLSNISDKILDIVLLTNSYQPINNISAEEFLEFKFEYLIRKRDFDLIKKFLIKNPKINNTKLVKFYVDFHLTNSQIKESCEIFDVINLVTDEYLTNFKIYCLINQDKKEQAQLLFDLKSELEEVDEFFVKKFNVLMGYENIDNTLSDKNILYLHLSHKTSDNFNYEPNINTPIYVLKYLSNANLLKKTDIIDLENIDQIKLVEKATNDEIYYEAELLDLYKRFNFNINQLLNVKEAYKILPEYEGRALLYQRLLLTVDSEKKLELSSKLKKSFEDSNLSNAFNKELAKILNTIDEKNVPSNFTTFYKKNKEPNKAKENKIKINNKIIHQSKLINYFLNKTSLPKAEKEINDLLKKIKKNKKYSFTKKDIIMIESLKSDGVKILKKYENLYDYKSNLPSEINSKIVNGETALVLLRLIEIIGENEVENLDIDSISFVVGILNELKVIDLRNEVLLKVLPLKV